MPDIPDTVLSHYTRQKRITVTPPPIVSEPLPGVYVRRLNWHADARGSLIEAHRMSWENPGREDGKMVSDPWEHARQVYVSTTAKGSVKGWHLHLRQTDRFFLLSGRALLVLADLRGFRPVAGGLLPPDKLAQIMADPGLRRMYDDPDLTPPMAEIALDPRAPVRVDVPPGVLHGWIAFEDSAILNCVSHEYDGTDELRCDPHGPVTPFGSFVYDWHKRRDG